MLTQDDEALLAQALYEELTPAEEQRLQVLFRYHPELQQEYEQLQALVQNIPSEFNFETPDLTGTVMANLEASPPSYAMRFRPLFAMAACLVLVVTGYFVVVRPTGDTDPALQAAKNSPVATLLELADERRDRRDFTGAYRLLSTGWTELQETEERPELLQAMADVAFEDLQWYPQAQAHYAKLRIDAFETFQERDENIYRLSLLEESAGANGEFASLRALDAATDAGTLDELGGVMARYAGSIVAELAAEEATRVSMAELGLDDAPAGRLVALEKAIERTAHPAARAQLQLMAATINQDTLNDSERARELYDAVVRSGVGPLAEEAQRALARLTPTAE